MVCWAAISDFVDVSDLDLYTSSGINAQGFATQTLAKGVEQVKQQSQEPYQM